MTNSWHFKLYRGKRSWQLGVCSSGIIILSLMFKPEQQKLVQTCEGTNLYKLSHALVFSHRDILGNI
uniref:Uncharacterized protein n=1 Tax=Aegilops tauschii subsp. strangulata TaxID=200361 RepID=A0A453L764_AEGTS